jgi:hypothetical protein
MTNLKRDEEKTRNGSVAKFERDMWWSAEDHCKR